MTGQKPEKVGTKKTTREEEIKQLNILFSKYQTQLNRECKFSGCIMPSCTGKSIQAHSIQRSGILSSIAENGLVLHHKSNPFAQKKDLEEIGIAYTQLFSAIENQPYVNSPQQNILFAFRACAREYVTKWSETRSAVR